jgi:peptidoglycan/xylan/chitin deacetylase (PgdA/CDA1 family)
VGFVRFLAACCAVVLGAGAAPAADPPVDNGAVVVMYHRFGDGRYPSTNIRMDQFKKHVAELKKDKYTVMPLPEIVSALRRDEPLPEHAVAITVDDAYASVYENAWPILREAGFPFTLFVATEPVDAGMKSYMSWDQLREFADADLVTIGSQTHAHPHMPTLSAKANRRELRQSQSRFRTELGRAPDLFAYPYGEFSNTVKTAVREAGFVAAFGQHSGAIGRLSDMYALPRYALNESYGGMDRFRLAVNSLALPVTDVTPANNKLAPAQNPPLYGFTVHDSVARVDGINCFASGRGKVTLKRVTKRRIEVRLDAPFPEGRARINCTLQGPNGRWRWFGNQFFVAGE